MSLRLRRDGAPPRLYSRGGVRLGGSHRGPALNTAASYATVWLLAAMLVVVPPGGAVCWPMPNGWHIHIGWSDAAGRPTPGLVVYAHRATTRVSDPHHPGFSALVAPDIVNLSDLRPLATDALWLLPLLTLCWLCLWQDAPRRLPGLMPLEHPPKSK
jgi:hypothetical protein